MLLAVSIGKICKILEWDKGRVSEASYTSPADKATHATGDDDSQRRCGRAPANACQYLLHALICYKVYAGSDGVAHCGYQSRAE